MKYGLYIKLFKDQQNKTDLEMIYTENFEWVKARDKANKYSRLLSFCVQLNMLLLCCVLMSASAMVVYPEILFLKALTFALSATSLIFCLIFNSVVLIKYNRYKNWQAEYEKTFEYLDQMAKIIEKGKTKKNDLR